MAITKEMSKAYLTHLLYPQEKGSSVIYSHFLPLTASVHPIALTMRPGKLFSPRTLYVGLRIFRERRPRILFCHTFWPGLQALMLKLLTGLVLVLDEHNAEHVRFKRCGSRLWRLVKVYEAVLCRHADCIFAVSDTDRESITSLGIDPRKLAVATNGIDNTVFHPEPDAGRRAGRDSMIPDGPVVLFFGNLAYAPNREAIVLIERIIVPQVVREVPEARFVIAGPDPPLLGPRGPNLFFVGQVPRIEDVINLSEVVICPLASGGGTRLKILESIACGKRVVSTTIGAEGLDVEATKGMLFVEDDWVDFSRSVARLLREPSTATTPSGFLERYSWTRIVADQIVATISRTLQETKAPPTTSK